MSRSLVRTLGLAIPVVFISLASCSGGATATLEFKNQTGVSTSTSGLSPKDVSMSIAKPTRFAMRLAMVYLAEDIDSHLDNTGHVARIWESEHCSGVADCDYFDLAQGSAAVNAMLNAKAASVAPGTYRYLRLEFCEGVPSHANVEWQAPGMPLPHGWISGTCGIDSKRMDPPLVIGQGDNVTVSLGYDLAQATMTSEVTPEWKPEAHAFYDNGKLLGAFADCVRNSNGTTATCVNLPTFTPTASK